MKKINVSLVALAIIVIAATSFSIIARQDRLRVLIPIRAVSMIQNAAVMDIALMANA